MNRLSSVITNGEHTGLPAEIPIDPSLALLVIIQMQC